MNAQHLPAGHGWGEHFRHPISYYIYIAIILLQRWIPVTYMFTAQVLLYRIKQYRDVNFEIYFKN